MSLINDALKLARQQNQSASATAVAPTLLPVEHPTRPRPQSGGFKSVLPMLIAVALTASAFLLWQWSRGETIVHARTADVPVAVAPENLVTKAAAMHAPAAPPVVPVAPKTALAAITTPAPTPAVAP